MPFAVNAMLDVLFFGHVSCNTGRSDRAVLFVRDFSCSAQVWVGGGEGGGAGMAHNLDPRALLLTEGEKSSG